MCVGEFDTQKELEQELLSPIFEFHDGDVLTTSFNNSSHTSVYDRYLCRDGRIISLKKLEDWASHGELHGFNWIYGWMRETAGIEMYRNIIFKVSHEIIFASLYDMLDLWSKEKYITKTFMSQSMDRVSSMKENTFDLFGQIDDLFTKSPYLASAKLIRMSIPFHQLYRTLKFK